MPPSQLIQVTNIAPMATREQIRTLFGYLGKIEDMTMYPTFETHETPSKMCYIRYADGENPTAALHLNNTVFIDRALIVFPLDESVDSIPTEQESQKVQAPANTTAGVLPKTADWPFKVMSMVVGKPGDQSIQTVDHQLTELGLPPYPPLPATTDGNRIEEIRRTILVTNLHIETTAQQVIEFFSPIAEVKFARLAAGTGPGSEGDERAAFVEFTEQASVAKAFALIGVELNNRQIIIQHATCAIIKPASHYGSSSLDDHRKLLSRRPSRSPSQDKGSSRSENRRRSSSRSRRRSRSPRRRHHRSRSRSPRRRRGRSGSRSRASRRSRSRGRRSKSRERRRSRSRGRRSRSRKRSRSRGKRSRSRDRRRSRSRGRRSRSRDRRRSRSKGRRSRSRSRDRRRGNDKKKEEEKRKERRKDKDRDKDRSKDREKDKEKEKKDDKEKDKPKEGKVQEEIKVEEKGKTEEDLSDVPLPPPPPPPPPPEEVPEPPSSIPLPEAPAAESDIKEEPIVTSALEETKDDDDSMDVSD